MSKFMYLEIGLQIFAWVLLVAIAALVISFAAVGIYGTYLLLWLLRQMSKGE